MHLRTSLWRSLLLAGWVAMPLTASAQNGLGLDLSDDKPADKPVKPADKPPPTDTIPDIPTEPIAPKKAQLDVGEKDVSLEDRVKSVQKKGFDKKGHFELAP